jgi:hypothetical protein
MAAYSVVRAAHKTLSTTVQDTVTLTAEGESLEVSERTGTNPLYFWLLSGTITSAADNSYFVRQGTTKRIPKPPGSVLVKVVGNANAYSVEVI